jgi:hypothetical protein
MPYLLLILQIGLPGPLFVFDMPDARNCYMNAVAMTKVLNDEKASAVCFDKLNQVLHVLPKPEGEKVE